MQSLSPGDLLTLGGATIVVSLIVEVLLRALGPSFDATRFGPLLALLIGVIVVGAVSALEGADIVAGIITGLLAGGSAMGVQNVVTQSILQTQTPAVSPAARPSTPAKPPNVPPPA